MASYDKVKIVVVGDSGVGKTSLTHLLCQNAPISQPYWTIGCSVDVKLHEYKAGTNHEKTFFVELWDVGGWSAHKNSRAIFYNSLNGIILVHDLTNRKSQLNLKKWLGEILNRDSQPDHDGSEFDTEQLVGCNIPIFVVGTKLEMTSSGRNDVTHRRISTIAEELGADEINLDSSHGKYIAPGTGNAVKISRFYDKVGLFVCKLLHVLDKQYDTIVLNIFLNKYRFYL
ncbi:hypothetical protein HELRODRAFT_84252 [Helobdella robusta]|uniref:Uncharacterized protein n=1 Tax=Helobdella robusta TaxID=6412 RepID=T1G5G5_HELRO|nr:hypothetical protein HELRODRAFT_84252 [Helobdella robusta]ESN99618.1 hypothetical protein HELRODRAFT_84252 [Helobdella robusta]